MGLHPVDRPQGRHHSLEEWLILPEAEEEADPVGLEVDPTLNLQMEEDHKVLIHQEEEDHRDKVQTLIRLDNQEIPKEIICRRNRDKEKARSRTQRSLLETVTLCAVTPKSDPRTPVLRSLLCVTYSVRPYPVPPTPFSVLRTLYSVLRTSPDPMTYMSQITPHGAIYMRLLLTELSALSYPWQVTSYFRSTPSYHVHLLLFLSGF